MQGEAGDEGMTVGGKIRMGMCVVGRGGEVDTDRRSRGLFARAEGRGRGRAGTCRCWRMHVAHGGIDPASHWRG